MSTCDNSPNESKVETPEKAPPSNQYPCKPWAQFLEDYEEIFSKIKDPKIKEKLLGTPFTVNTVICNDALYEGEMKEGQLEGRGMILRHPLKTFFFGEWSKGKINGLGIQYCFKSGELAEGEWVDNKLAGFGRKTWMKQCTEDQDDTCEYRYEGDFQNGCPHGFGKIIYNCSHNVVSQYEGEWMNGQRNGHGTELSKFGDKYIGNFKDGLKHGKGKWYCNDVLCYEGNYLNNQYHGNGKHYHDGRLCYEGEYKENKPDGFGTLYYADGGSFVGRFKDGIPNGVGILCESNGYVWGGNWLGGVFVPLKEDKEGEE